MAKARIEYEEDETSRMYRLKRWYGVYHWDVKRAIKKITLLLMFVPVIYLIGAMLIIASIAYPIVLGIVAALVLACVAIGVIMSD